MILRRITKHVKDQNWFAVGLDFMIVVLGVFLGIQIGNWNEDRKSQNLGAEYIERLQTDIEFELALWGKAIDYYGTARDYGQIAAAGFNTPVDTLDEQFLIALYQASQVWFVAPNRATFDELQSTGRIVDIRDTNLRTLMSNHYLRVGQTGFTLNQTSEYRRIARLNIDTRISSAIRKNCGDRWVTEDNNFYFVELPKACEIDLPLNLIRQEIAAVHANEAVRRELSFHLSVLDAQLGTMNNALTTGTKTLTHLKAAKQ